jgi:hypothetical protein
MSYSNNQNQRPFKMHCKVCESAKKSPATIASHFPKNRDGKTVCPTLLAQQCKKCGVKGHTVSYCTTIIEPKKKEYIPPVPIAKSKETKTAYDSLYISDDEEKEEKEEKEHEVKKQAKKEKKTKATGPTGPPKKFCWATAESDSSGEEEEE